jgi:predicted molibdopterin-dependent oxidoreductase YjgC
VLIYQGVLATALSKVADVVLPGSAWVEKDATFTNDQGQLQAVSKAISPPGEAVDDWQILTSVAAALGLPYTYTTSQQVRADVATAPRASRSTPPWPSRRSTVRSPRSTGCSRATRWNG